MISHMNPRQFKKLCVKCYALLVRHDPSIASTTHKAMRDNWYDWMPGDKSVRPGTMGFGGISGYYEREWSDSSAWAALTDVVFWHFALVDYESDYHPRWPDSIRRPRTWQEYLHLAHRMIAEQESI